MTPYSSVLLFFRLVAVCAGSYLIYALLSAWLTPAPNVANLMPTGILADFVKDGRDLVVRQLIMNIGASVILYACAPLLARLVTAGGNRR